MPRIVTLRLKREFKEDVISLVLSQDAVSVGPDGDPWCGLTLSADQARSLANRLFSIAAEIENGEESGRRTSTLLFEHVSSVVTLHDGSLQSHRAFQAAMRCASRSFGTVEVIGLLGVDTRGKDVTATIDDDWQKGWLTRLTEMYSQKAESSGVTFRSRFLPASDPSALLDLLYGMEFDLLVIPKGLTQLGIRGERLMTSIISRRNVNVLVCP
jgi:hypothetical protein